TDPDWRARGLAVTLMNELLEVARLAGLSEVLFEFVQGIQAPAIEAAELAAMPEAELSELEGLLGEAGMSEQTAKAAARELTEHDALGTHARVELDIDPSHDRANPVTAALASLGAFIAGGLIPFLVVLFAANSAAVLVTVIGVEEKEVKNSFFDRNKNTCRTENGFFRWSQERLIKFQLAGRFFHGEALVGYGRAERPEYILLCGVKEKDRLAADFFWSALEPEKVKKLSAKV
ncbi:MAG TPA: VIT1/CCC1 transporter family protein, partial [bacterium]|nr:VIT1/CCC1 transporter family protein [bacterium]